MDAKLPMETFETVFALASEGCKAIAERVREVKTMEFLNPFFFLSFVPTYLSEELNTFNKERKL